MKIIKTLTVVLPGETVVYKASNGLSITKKYKSIGSVSNQATYVDFFEITNENEEVIAEWTCSVPHGLEYRVINVYNEED